MEVLEWVKARAVESSTWRGLGVLLVAVGVLPAGAVEVVVSLGVALVGLVEVVRAEK